MSLREEIQEKRKEIVVDAYAMSIGEIVNLYNDEELDVHPEFQRFFRWDDNQKTRLIESILLGIPIPPIFVSQKTNGKWDVIDGQQRLSTILQFMQRLKNVDGALYEPLILKKAKFLPSLENVRWNDDELFSPELKISFKREKINITIIKETGENDTSKYEMFQRLNTGGTHLSPQEIRNCLLIMVYKPLYEVIQLLGNYEHFLGCLPLSENQCEEQFNLELVVKTLLFTTYDANVVNNYDKSRNMDELITEQIEKIADCHAANYDDFGNKFKRCFDLLDDVMHDNAFKKWNGTDFKGAMLVSAFETIVPGLYDNVDYWVENKEELKEKIKQIYSRDEYINAVRRGVRPVERMMKLVSFSRSWFAHEN